MGEVKGGIGKERRQQVFEGKVNCRWLGSEEKGTFRSTEGDRDKERGSEFVAMERTKSGF